MYIASDMSTFHHSYYVEKGGDNFYKAVLLYKLNVKIAESLYPVLNVLEVAFRTSVNSRMIELKGDKEWLKNFTSDSRVRTKVRNSRNATNDMIVGNLTFGEWITIY